MSIIKKTGDHSAIDFLALARILLRRLHFILLAMVVCAVAFYTAVLFLVTPTYRASITLYVNNSTRGDSTAISNADLNASARLVDTYAAIIVSDTVTEAVAEAAGVEHLASSLAGRISVSAVNETEVFTVSVVNPDPEIAARLANAIAEVAPERISAIVEGSTVAVIDYAKVPRSISSPNYKISARMGALVGLLLSVAVIVIRTLLDNSIKGSSDLAAWDYPVLSVIPELDSAESARSSAYGSKRAKA